MSLVRVYFNPLNGADREEFTVDPGTQIIEFLQEHYPTGFEGFLRVFVGIEEIAIDDLDRVIEEEELVTLLVMPAGAVGAYIAANAIPILVNALIATAIGFVINLIFKPSTPNSGADESESPVYSLNASRNTARLGDPIECHYGSVSFPPSFAAAPYQFYFEGSNDMFVDELLCLGHGEFDIEQIWIGDSPITSIEPGSVQYWTFTPLQHQQTMGNISNRIAAWDADSPYPWPFRENMFTSPEVEGFEFSDERSDAVTSPIGFAGSAFATAYDPVSQSVVTGHVKDVPAGLDIRAGDEITLAGTVSNNATFTIGSVVVQDASFVTLFQSYESVAQFADEDPLPGGTTYTMNDAVDDTVAGPFRAQKSGQIINEVECDIIFPQGLYRVDGTSGKIKTHTVTVNFTYQQIQEDGTPIGIPVTQSKVYTEKKRSPVRSTVRSGPLTPGAYEVTVAKVWIQADEDDSRKHGITTWAGLKGVVVNATQPVYNNTTLLAIRMRATNGLGSAARARIRVTAKRKLPDTDSSNPIAAIKDIWTSTDYGLGRPLDELDTASLDLLQLDWALPDGPRFNGSFDKRDTGFAAMQAVAGMTGSKVVQIGGLTTVILDRQQPVRTALFSTANIVSNSMEILYSFDSTDDYDGIQVEYRNAENFQVEYVTYPPNAKLPDTFVLFGCTDATYAQEYARYLDNVKKIRRKQVSFTTELEGLLPRFGDRIGVAHSVPQWGHSGVIVEVLDTVTFRVDQNLTWNGDKVMILRSDVGKPSSEYTVTRGTSDDIVVFPEIPDVAVNGPEGMEPTSYTFGDPGQILRDFILTKITPKGDTQVEIEGQTYTANIYTGAPAHMRV